MQQIKLPAETAKILPPRRIPVFAGCCEGPFMQYEIADLFSAYGNGDGDDHLLCAVAQIIIDTMYECGITVETSGGLHNNVCIESVTSRNRGETWEWKSCPDEKLNHKASYAELFRSLPAMMQEVLLRLAQRGVCLLDEATYDERLHKWRLVRRV